MNAATVSGPCLTIKRFELVGEPRGELLLGLAILREAVIVRTGRMQETRQWNVEIAMIAGKSGERGSGDGDAVIGLHTADDLFLLRFAARVVEIPDKLDLGVVRLRSGIAEEHLRDRHRRDLLELLGKLDRRIVALAGEEMRERKLAHLRGGGLDQFFVAVAERRAPKPGHAFDIGLAVGIVDIDALAALDDERAGVAEAREIGVGMHQRLDVADGKIAERGHKVLWPKRCGREVLWPWLGGALAVICSPIVAIAAAPARLNPRNRA